MNNLIIGYGEIGQRLWRILKKGYLHTDWVDIDRSSDAYMPNKEYQVINICLPYYEHFDTQVIEYANMHKPELVVIWSSIEPGLCINMQRDMKHPVFENHKAHVVHTPLLIVELSVEGSIRACDQIMGYDTEQAKEAGIRYLRQCFNVLPVKGTDTAAVGKLLSTTQYAMAVSFNQEMERICKRYKVDYNIAVREVTRLYNEGYKKLGKEKYVRPLLFPGVIGGHCQMENIKIIKQRYKSKFLNAIEESNERYKKKTK